MNCIDLKESLLHPAVEYLKDFSTNDYVHKWYPLLKDLTFETWIVPFNKDEAEILLEVCKLGLSSTREKGGTLLDKFQLFELRLKEKLSEILSSFSENPGFFIRLGSRSCKDAVLYSELGMQRFVKILEMTYYEREYIQLKTKAEKLHWISKKGCMADWKIIFESEIRALQCFTTEDFFDLFLNSQRIVQDLTKEIESPNPNFEFVIRKWGATWQEHLEFRGFVVNHKLTGLYQYNHFAYYPDIVENKGAILEAIQGLFYKEVVPRLSVKESIYLETRNYVIDFGVMIEEGNGGKGGAQAVAVDKKKKGNSKLVHAMVIELNEYKIFAGPGLFDWEKDVSVLTGEAPFEFRTIEEHDKDKVAYEYEIHPAKLGMAREVKRALVEKGKSWWERKVSWKEAV